jgi:cytochrome c oxidase cbb3-type subunit I/II
VNTKHIEKKINVMRTLGVPYDEGYENQALSDLQEQALHVKANLEIDGIEVNENLEIVALIAYLQRLGTDISKVETPEAAVTTGGNGASNK